MLTFASMASTARSFFVLFAGSLAACNALLGTDPAGVPASDDNDASDSNEGAPGTSKGAPDGGDQVEAVADGGDGGGQPAVCTEATCPPETLQQGLYAPAGVAVNGSYIFWIEVGTKIPQANQYGQLIRLPKDSKCKQRSCYEVLDYYVLGGEFEGLYIYGTQIALGLSDVCYTQSFNANPGHSISCFALANPSKRKLDDSPGEVVDLWVGATEARWAISSTAAGNADGAIAGRPLKGGTVKVLAPSRFDPTGVTSDGSKTYWTELGAASPQGAVLTLGADGGSAPIVTGQPAPLRVRVFGEYLYWIDWSARKILRTRADGSGTAEQIATTDEKPRMLVVDASGVYWTCSGTGNQGMYGSVAHAPLTPNGAVTIMMKDIDKVRDIATDSDFLYVASTGTNLDAGKIVRMKKTQ